MKTMQVKAEQIGSDAQAAIESAVETIREQIAGWKEQADSIDRYLGLAIIDTLNDGREYGLELKMKDLRNRMDLILDAYSRLKVADNTREMVGEFLDAQA